MNPLFSLALEVTGFFPSIKIFLLQKLSGQIQDFLFKKVG